MSEVKSRNDEAWEELFNKYDILNQIDMRGSFQISANQIKAKKILHKSYKQRQLDFCCQIPEHKVFSIVLKKYFDTGGMPSYDEIIMYMKKSNLYKVESDTTFERRASTVRGWIEWIVGLINE